MGQKSTQPRCPERAQHLKEKSRAKNFFAKVTEGSSEGLLLKKKILGGLIVALQIKFLSFFKLLFKLD